MTTLKSLEKVDWLTVLAGLAIAYLGAGMVVFYAITVLADPSKVASAGALSPILLVGITLMYFGIEMATKKSIKRVI